MESEFQFAMRDALKNQSIPNNALPNKLIVEYGESVPFDTWEFNVSPSRDGVTCKSEATDQLNDDSNREGSIQNLVIRRDAQKLSAGSPNASTLTFGATYDFKFHYSWSGTGVQPGFREVLARISTNTSPTYSDRLTLFDPGANPLETTDISRANSNSGIGVKYTGHVIGPSGGFTATDLWLRTGSTPHVQFDFAGVEIPEGYRADLEVTVRFS